MKSTVTAVVAVKGLSVARAAQQKKRRISMEESDDNCSLADDSSLDATLDDYCTEEDYVLESDEGDDDAAGLLTPSVAVVNKQGSRREKDVTTRKQRTTKSATLRARKLFDGMMNRGYVRSILPDIYKIMIRELGAEHLPSSNTVKTWLRLHREEQRQLGIYDHKRSTCTFPISKAYFDTLIMKPHCISMSATTIHGIVCKEGMKKSMVHQELPSLAVVSKRLAEHRQEIGYVHKYSSHKFAKRADGVVLADGSDGEETNDWFLDDSPTQMIASHPASNESLAVYDTLDQYVSRVKVVESIKQADPFSGLVYVLGIDENHCHEVVWNKYFRLLQQFKHEHGHTFGGNQLKRFLDSQRKKYWHGALHWNRKEKLDAIDFEWGTTDNNE